MIEQIQNTILRSAYSEVEGPRKNLSNDKLKEACIDFEALFIKQMLNSMRNTIHKTGLTEGGMAEDIFEDMLYDEYAKVMAKTGSFGVSEMMYNELSDKSNL